MFLDCMRDNSRVKMCYLKICYVQLSSIYSDNYFKSTH